MDTEQHEGPASRKPPPPARFRGGRLLFWLPWSAVHGGLVAWAAVVVEQFRAPVLLFSLLVGVVLGVTLVGMIRVCQVGNRPTIVVGTGVAALTAVLGQHYAGYRIAYREAVDDAQTYRLANLAFEDEVLGEMPVPPAGFVDFLRWRAARGLKLPGYEARGPVIWLIWAADAFLVLAAALTVMVPALRKPYCDRCASWFGTTRRGSIEAQAARHLAAVIETELPDEPASARYRLFACHGGCGPTGLELRWEEPGGKSSWARGWLDAERRNQVVQALDKGISYV